MGSLRGMINSLGLFRARVPFDTCIIITRDAATGAVQANTWVAEGSPPANEVRDQIFAAIGETYAGQLDKQRH